MEVEKETNSTSKDEMVSKERILEIIQREIDFNPIDNYNSYVHEYSKGYLKSLKIIYEKMEWLTT